METINATETMKTITETKGELVNIINGLYGVQSLKGKKFSLLVSKNISILVETLKDLEKAGKPSDEFIKLAEQVNEISTNSTGYKKVNEGKYHDYRNDDTMSSKQKIGRSMREVRDGLNHLEKLVKMNVRLKNELSVNSDSYWKNTHKALHKISERLVKLANKVGQLQ